MIAILFRFSPFLSFLFNIDFLSDGLLVCLSLLQRLQMFVINSNRSLCYHSNYYTANIF